jgi:protein-disulfide isomerase
VLGHFRRIYRLGARLSGGSLRGSKAPRGALLSALPVTRRPHDPYAGRRHRPARPRLRRVAHRARRRRRAAGDAARPALGAASGQAKADPASKVATFDGGAVTAGELDEVIKRDLAKAEADHQQRLHELRRAGVDALVTKKLVEAKAKAAGVSPEALVKREVDDKIGAPAEQEMRGLYDQARASGQPLPPYEQVKGDIDRYLRSQRTQDARRAWYDKLRADAKVEVLLPAYQPPRVAVAAEGPSKGPASAPVTIVEFSDFECPFCVRAEETVKQVMKQYEGKVRLVYRDFPLPNHRNAHKAAEAAHCAGDQAKYWEMHEKLFASHTALGVPQLKGYAKELGLDAAKFDRCLDSGEKAKLVDAGKKAGEEAGVTGTPAFFVNGMLLSGAQPVEAFKALIDAELSKVAQK